jgi:hypothetical protein
MHGIYIYLSPSKNILSNFHHSTTHVTDYDTRIDLSMTIDTGRGGIIVEYFCNKVELELQLEFIYIP